MWSAGGKDASDLYTGAEDRLFQSGSHYSRLLHDQLQLLLQQMQFCAAEIAAMEGKEVGVGVAVCAIGVGKVVFMALHQLSCWHTCWPSLTCTYFQQFGKLQQYLCFYAVFADSCGKFTTTNINDTIL